MYNPFSLENKTILVTGASSGIGKATAIECSKLGASVIITGRNEERLRAVWDELDRSFGQQHLMVIADLATDEVIGALVSEMPCVDGVSSNAGIPMTQLIKFIKQETLETVWNINTVSHVNLAKLLFKKKKLNTGASYVFTASIGGTTSFGPGNAVYGMSKAAINSFMKFCAIEFSTRMIRCNCVSPGMTVTPMTQDSSTFTKEDYERDAEKYLLKRYGQPEEVAKTIVFLLSDASSFITGDTILVDGGFTANH
jgi:NAD(P)-dependent dehydrogenase (short-subunit alcohol dehydrogenase family)